MSAALRPDAGVKGGLHSPRSSKPNNVAPARHRRERRLAQPALNKAEQFLHRPGIGAKGGFGMTFYFFRHGATRGNLEKRYVGSTDEPLLIEARAALAALRPPAVRRVFASPMRRCVQTAGILWPDAPTTLVPDFRECDFGAFEYGTYEQLKDRAEYRQWLDSAGNAPFPGGESRGQFSARVVRAFDLVALEAQALGGAAALVVHGGTIMAILEARALPRRDFYAYQVQNGGGYRAEWKDGALYDLRPL
jgi:alpha-ribazole phosphatase